jgi:hypothetical protein
MEMGTMNLEKRHTQQNMDTVCGVVAVETGGRGMCGRELPDHPFKEVLNDQMGLSDNDQQGHMGPGKLKNKQENTNINNLINIHNSLAIARPSSIADCTLVWG